MPRRPNTKPTIIYWLVDMRPETLTRYPDGWPFYCGKTIEGAEVRLKNHRAVARKHPSRPVSGWLNACGLYVKIQIMETIAAPGNWCERERFWIGTIRLFYPGGANVTDGGEGTPGLIQSREHRAKLSAAHTGKKKSPEHRAKMFGRLVSVETRAKISAVQKGRKRPPETCAKISAGHKGRRKSAETRANMSAAQKGRTFSVEHLAKLSAAQCARFARSRKANARS